MNDLQSISFEKVLAIYDKYFSLGYLNTDVSDKLACISLTCYLTNALREKGQKVNCYQVLLQVGKDMPDLVKNTQSATGFDIAGHDIVFHGVCTECKQKKGQ